MEEDRDVNLLYPKVLPTGAASRPEVDPKPLDGHFSTAIMLSRVFGRLLALVLLRLDFSLRWCQ